MFQYIQENKHKSFIDAGALVDSLREQYPEYLRRQKVAVKYLAGRGIYSRKPPSVFCCTKIHFILVFAKLMAEEEEESKADAKMSVESIASDSEDLSLIHI